MGAYPSVAVYTIHSSAIDKDVDCLQYLFPGSFEVERHTHDTDTSTSDTVVLFGSEFGKLTLILVPVESDRRNESSSPASNRSNSTTRRRHRHVQTIAMEEKDIRAVATRSSQSEQLEVILHEEDHAMTAEIVLPGGSGLFLVTPILLASASGRLILAQQLAESCSSATATYTHQTFTKAETRNDDDNLPPTEAQQIREDKGSDYNKAVTRSLLSSTCNNEDTMLPGFPSLEFSYLQQDGSYAPFPLNSRTGVPVETDLFHGRILFILRPDNPPVDDPYWYDRIFVKKKRRLIIQIQGKLKYKPESDLYAGCEVSEQMKLGLLARGLSKVLLGLVERFNPTFHYSFGDSQGEELAHIVVPAFAFFERFIITKPGEAPPPLEDPFEEPPESIKDRKSSVSSCDWNTTDTYSMGFFSMYIDLPTWSIVNLPVSSDINLKTFWGKSLLRVVLYERAAPHSEQKHLQRHNNYGFVIQAKYLGPVAKTERADNLKASKESKEPAINTDGGTILDWTEAPYDENDSDMNRSESQLFIVDDDEPVDMSQFFDAEENEKDDGESMVPAASERSQDLTTSVDCICPAWIEMIGNRGSYARVYAFNPPGSSRTLYRSSTSMFELLGQGGNNTSCGTAMAGLCSPRMSSAERTRRWLGQFVADMDPDVNGTALNRLESMTTLYDKVFLRRPVPPLNRKLLPRVTKSGFVARALSDHHWIEEWAILTDHSIAFHHPDKKKANHRVQIRNVLKVQRLEPSHSPCFPNHYFLCIGTLGRTIYLMLDSLNDRDEWFDMVSQFAKATRNVIDNGETSSYGPESVTSLLEIQSSKDEFLHKSSMWDFKHRRVLNCRQFSFRSRVAALQRKPNDLVEDALRKALDPRNESDDDVLILFLDSAAKLKEANAQMLEEQKRVVFFLNLYHVMVMHAYLVLGTPESSFHWITYFNSISYQCSDDIFALTELEHCIIRARMSSPSQFISRFVLPKSKYTFALQTADNRINFALNCGSLSNPGSVPIYSVDSISMQLDQMARLYLASSVKVKRRGSADLEVALPRICQWFADDFGGNNDEVLKTVTRLLTEGVQKALSTCLASNGNITVKYLAYNFACRKITRFVDQVPTTEVEIR